MFSLISLEHWFGAYIFLMCVCGIIYCWMDLNREEKQKKRVEAKESTQAKSPVYIRRCTFVYPELKSENEAKVWGENLKAYR